MLKKIQYDAILSEIIYELEIYLIIQILQYKKDHHFINLLQKCVYIQIIRIQKISILGFERSEEAILQ